MKMITILGPTATGKTRLAAHLARKIGAEIISVDSRQVYRGMDIGTGKDKEDYGVDGQQVPYHLVDIVDAGYEYNLFEYQQNFHKVYDDIRARGKEVVFCGGTGLYIQSVLQGYRLIAVAPDPDFRKQTEAYSDDELKEMLSANTQLHNVTDTGSRKRLIRALEIALKSGKNESAEALAFGPVDSVIFGISYPRDEVRNRITDRLKIRLGQGLIEEVKGLMSKGLTPEQLLNYGLEYKYVTQYILRLLTYEEMAAKLNISIHQFSKRQMTWFRKMERDGFVINWIDGSLPLKEKVEQIINKVSGGE
jgi:tRNA dimethylallyltransferase